MEVFKRNVNWTTGLNPIAELQDGAVKHDMRVREVFGEEKNELWKRADAAWPDFPAYRARAGREIPVLVLEPLV